MSTDTNQNTDDGDDSEPLVHPNDVGVWDRPESGGTPIDGSEAENATQASPDTQPVEANSNTMLPVDRDYDFSEAIETGVPEYVESGRELRSTLLDLKGRHKDGIEPELSRKPRFLYAGPTSCGKTLAARHIAANVLQCPLFTIQCYHGMRQSNLIGKVAYVGGETVYIDSVMTKALLASKEGPVVVLIDEMNRAPTKYKDIFFPFLDGRCQVTIPERGNEVIKGDPKDLIVIGTINQGAGYSGTESSGIAELRRYGNMFETDYLGMDTPRAEARLVAERTGAGEKLGSRLVNVANAIRKEARVEGSDVNMGLPTGTVLNWARTAYGYDGTFSDPVVKAAHDSFIKMHYSGSDAEREFVIEEVELLGGCGVTDEDVTAWEKGDYDAGGDYKTLGCGNCAFEGQADEIGESHLAMMDCPDCGGVLKVV